MADLASILQRHDGRRALESPPGAGTDEIALEASLAATLARRLRGKGFAIWFTLVGALLGALLASLVAWIIETQMTGLMLAQVAARARDQVELGILRHVTAADFEPPYAQTKLDDLGARLDPLLVRARQEGSGVLRLNLYARDGTIVYSDLASLRGQAVSPLSKPYLAGALAGSAGVEISSLSTLENADLQPRYGSALEAYVPFVVDGRVAGVYEFYQDLAPIRPIRPLVWSVSAAGFLILFLSLLVLVQGAAARQRPQHARGERLAPQPTEADAPREAAFLHALALPEQVTPTEKGRTPGLTPRELEVLQLMVTCSTYRDIGSQLVLSEETVRSHAKSILHKLGQPDRTGAVVAALRLGILKLS